MTEFTTKLASPIELTDEWEVGLAEIMFPRSWYTIPKTGSTFLTDYRRCDIAWKHDMMNKIERGYDPSDEEIDTEVRIFVKGGFYNSMEELTEELNQASIRTYTHLAKTMKPPTFDYKSTTRRMYVTLPPGMSITFPPILETILGFSWEQNPCAKSREQETVRGELSCDLQTGIHAIYVYCDLLQYTNVGNIKAPLLRVVDSGGEAGDVVTRYYERPRYVPIQKKCFETIQIVLRDDLGEKILFENGKVLLTLHFRRARNRYLL